MNLLAACLLVLLYPGHVKRTIDSDTFILFHVGVPAEERVRLLGVDGVELRDTLGLAGRAFTDEWVRRDTFRLHTCQRDSFGRLLGVATRGVDTLAVSLIQAGLGVKR